jgi:hypothetical protein
MYLVLSYTSFQICFMLSVQKHIGISCSHCWSEFIMCWASNFPIHQFYAHALKCIHTFWVIYLLIMEIHSLSTRFENAYFRMLRKSFYSNGCNVIIGWFLGISCFESMFPCFPWWWLHWVYLVAERTFYLFWFKMICHINELFQIFDMFYKTIMKTCTSHFTRVMVTVNMCS